MQNTLNAPYIPSILILIDINKYISHAIDIGSDAPVERYKQATTRDVSRCKNLMRNFYSLCVGNVYLRWPIVEAILVSSLSFRFNQHDSHSISWDFEQVLSFYFIFSLSVCFWKNDEIYCSLKDTQSI